MFVETEDRQIGKDEIRQELIMKLNPSIFLTCPNGYKNSNSIQFIFLLVTVYKG